MYEKLSFPILTNRPHFYSNFVQTIDGKIEVLPHSTDYWPIGSRIDHSTLLRLRGHTDALIHGKGTALEMNTIKALSSPSFQDLRRQLGKTKPLLYLIISGHPDSKLISQITPSPVVKILLVTTREAALPELPPHILVTRLGKSNVDIDKLAAHLKKEHQIDSALIEGGPRLMASFLQADLIDEVFTTIAPKIFGGNKNTLTMIEGYVSPPTKVPEFRLKEVNQISNELFLRYSRLS